MSLSSRGRLLVMRRLNLDGRPMKSSSSWTDKVTGFKVCLPSSEAWINLRNILCKTWCFGMMINNARPASLASKASCEYLRKKRIPWPPTEWDSSGARNAPDSNICLILLFAATQASPARGNKGSADKSSVRCLCSMNFIRAYVTAPLCHPADGKVPVVGHWMDSFVILFSTQPSLDWEQNVLKRSLKSSKRPSTFAANSSWEYIARTEPTKLRPTPRWKLWKRSKAQMSAASLGTWSKRRNGGSVANGFWVWTVWSHTGRRVCICSYGTSSCPALQIWQMPFGASLLLAPGFLVMLLNVLVKFPLLPKNGQSPQTCNRTIQYRWLYLLQTPVVAMNSRSPQITSIISSKIYSLPKL